MSSFKKILVAVDFSEPSKKAVTYGLSLADQFKSELIIAHIVPESSALMYAFPTQMPEIEQQQYEKARREIPSLVPAEYAARLNLQTIVKIGGIEEELLGIVKAEAVDLMVMGTHGRKFLGRWFIGSVTEHMLRKVPVPLLTGIARGGRRARDRVRLAEADPLHHRPFRVLKYRTEIRGRAREGHWHAAHCDPCH